jgi:carbamoyl-phosphate synthase small subunit
MSGVDTRRLTRHVRRAGAMRGALSTEVTHADELIDIARSSPGYEGRDLVDVVSTARPYAWEPEDAAARRPVLHGPRRPPASSRHLRLGRRAKVAAFDYGIKRSMLDLLVAHGCDVTVLPATTEADSVVAGRFDGVFLSNGPGDPEPVDYAVRTIRRLLGRVPLFGVCLGHQLLARALGATTYKLPFGHRGANHPVRMVGSQRVEITSQNHGFAVDTGSLERTAAALTHINLNDSTVEGIEVPGVAFAVQYHPEASPGPHDSRYLFDRFIDLIATFDAPRAVAPEAP